MNQISEDNLPKIAETRLLLGNRSLALVGMMGCGKSSVGRRLARVMGLPFVDADHEIEEAAGTSIEDIFKNHGEAFFRDREQAVIQRILSGPPVVLATGGGAFMNENTRQLILERSLCIWLKATLDTLTQRVSRKDNRPLLKGKNARHVLEQLTKVRHPIYARAHIVVPSDDIPHERTVQRIVQAITCHLSIRDHVGRTDDAVSFGPHNQSSFTTKY